MKLLSRRGRETKGKGSYSPIRCGYCFPPTPRVIRGKVEADENIHAYRLAVMTGLRPGELLGLRVGDVDGNRLHLSRAINTLNEETSGKNENALTGGHPASAGGGRTQSSAPTAHLRRGAPLAL